jgi:transcriptional regulator with XRE-family HTH domain
VTVAVEQRDYTKLAEAPEEGSPGEPDSRELNGISLLERGIAGPTLPRIFDLAEALQIPPGEEALQILPGELVTAAQVELGTNLTSAGHLVD